MGPPPPWTAPSMGWVQAELAPKTVAATGMNARILDTTALILISCLLYLRAQCSCGSLSTGRRYHGSPVHENDPSVQMEGCGPLEVFKSLFILSMAVHMAMKETRWSRSTISRLGPSIVMAPRAACGRATGWSPLRPTPLL